MSASIEPVSPCTPPRTAFDFSIELLQVVLESLYVGRDNKALLVARHGIILSANNRTCQLCGIAPEELECQRPIADFFTDVPEYVSAASVVRWEAELMTGEGVRIPIEIVREPLNHRLPDVLVYAIRDLSERRAAAAELEYKNQALLARERDLLVQNLRLATAINCIPLGLAMFDAEACLLVWNRQLESLVGLLGQQVIRGASIRDLVTASRVPTVHATFPEGTTRLADGRLLFLTKRTIPDGGFVLTAEDVS